MEERKDRDEKGLFLPGNKINTNAFTEAEIQKIADDLIKWSENPSSRHLNGFTRIYKKDRTWLYKIAEDNIPVSHALKIARDNIAFNYCIKMTNGEWSASSSYRYAMIHDIELKDLKEWEEKLKILVAEKSENKPILIELMKFIKETNDTKCQANPCDSKQ